MRSILSTIIATCTLVGCCSNAPPPEIDVPVIDMHAHVFNARDLPAKGILDALAARKGWNVPSWLTQRIANYLYRRTPREQEGVSEAPAVQSLQDLTEEERGALRDLIHGRQVQGEHQDPRLSDEELIAGALKRLGFLNDHGDQVHAEGLIGSLSGTIALLRTATRTHQGIVDRMTKAFGAQPTLFVHHMMDLERAYAEQPPVPFSEQTGQINRLVKKNPELLTFVAFDPFRGDQAMKMVRRGRKLGALGVKFYPPSGYRPLGNSILNRPERSGPLQTQWDSRYGQLGANPNAKLNALCKSLFAYCEKEGMPIFLHCTRHGFEAANGYGVHHSDPEYWVSVFETYPKLRVAFGHAGGYDGWSKANTWSPNPSNPGVGSDKSFERKVYELCVTHENAYADFGYHGFHGNTTDNVLRDALRVLLGRDDQATHPFGKKIMYGSDWYMVLSEGHPASGLRAFDKLFRNDLQAHRIAFFAGNAARFLGLRRLLTTGQFQGSQRSLVTELLAKLQ